MFDASLNCLRESCTPGTCFWESQDMEKLARKSTRNYNYSQSYILPMTHVAMYLNTYIVVDHTVYIRYLLLMHDPATKCCVACQDIHESCKHLPLPGTSRIAANIPRMYHRWTSSLKDTNYMPHYTQRHDCRKV